MSFVSGTFLIDAPASALNNLGSIPDARTDNTVGVKVIKTKEGLYPYVSAQAFRYWLRTTLEKQGQWKSAPVYREEKVAYTDANPLEWWDDDLFGYMRAPSKKTSAKEKREADVSRAGETETVDTITRVSPFRVSTLLSIAPAMPTDDFGTMSRQDGDPVPHEHQFYHTTLKGLFSLDLYQCGTFSYRQKTGYRNLDDVRQQKAQEKGLEHLEKDKSYRLPLAERIKRVATLFEGLAALDGGAKQAIHYTDVSPDVVIMAVTKGGNNIFGHVINANSSGLPTLNTDSFLEALTVFKDQILSDVYVGWTTGYMDDERKKFATFLDSKKADLPKVNVQHPRETFKAFVTDVQKAENARWME